MMGLFPWDMDEWDRTRPNDPRGRCSGCKHHIFSHVAEQCYACWPNPFCHWGYLGEGNVWGKEPGWHYRYMGDSWWREAWYVHPEDAYWER